jgi:hypothetical protein
VQEVPGLFTGHDTGRLGGLTGHRDLLDAVPSDRAGQLGAAGSGGSTSTDGAVAAAAA